MNGNISVFTYIYIKTQPARGIWGFPQNKESSSEHKKILQQ